MSKKKFILPLTVFALLLSFGLSACNNDNNGGEQGGEQESQQTSENKPSSAKQEKITVTATDNKTKLIYPDTVQLIADQDGVTWESAKPEIATVSATGLVTAVSKGSASIKAIKEGFKDGSINISVDYPSITISVADNKTNLMYGESVQLTSNVDGVAWTSSDATVASVSNAGLVEALKKGSTTITASKDHYNNATVTINVDYPNITVTAADNKTELQLGETVQLSSDVGGITWASDNATAVSVSETGLVTAVGYGKAKVSASKDHHNTGEVTITVVRPNASATLHMEDAEHYSADGTWSTDGRGPGADGPVYSPSSGNPSDGTCIAYFGAGDKETLKFTADKAVQVELVLTIGYYYTIDDVSLSIGAKFNDVALTVPSFKYESEGTSGYTYKQFSLGNVTLKNSGENVLELTMLENAQYYPYIDDLQFFAAEAINVSAVTAPTIEVTNENVALEVGQTSQIESATTGLSYASSNEAVATVSDSGLITAVAKGIAVITVSKEGMKPCKVNVMVTEVFAGAEYQIEAENCSLDSGILTRSTSSGETCTERWAADAVLACTFKSSVAGTYVLSFVGRAAGQYGTSDVSDIAAAMEVTVNDTPVTISGAVSGRTFTNYVLGDVAIVSGTNTITIKGLVANTVPNIDYLVLSPKAAA